MVRFFISFVMVVMMSVCNLDLGFGSKAADWDAYPDDIYGGSTTSGYSRGSSSRSSYSRPSTRQIVIGSTGGYANGAVRMANVGGAQATYAGSAQASEAGSSTSDDDMLFWGFVVFGIIALYSMSKCESKPRRRNWPQKCSYSKKMDRYYKTGIYSDYE